MTQELLSYKSCSISLLDTFHNNPRLHHCTKHTLETGDIKQRTEMYDELLDLIYRHLL